MSDSLSSLAKTVPTLKGTEIFTNWRRANTSYLLEKGAHRVFKGRETELLRDVHYIPAAQSNILLARQTAERRMDNQLARAHDAERQDQARHCLSRRPSLSRSAPPLHRPILHLQVSEPRRMGELAETETAPARQRSRRSCMDPAVLSTEPAAQSLRSGERSRSTASSLRGVLKAYDLTRLSAS